MSRISKVTAAILLSPMLGSCDGPTDFTPRRGVAIMVDSSAYHLSPASDGYAITLTATIVNDSDRDLFLSQDCGSWRLARASESDKTTLYLGAYECIEGQRQQPVAIAAGDEYSRTFRLTGTNSPLTRPRITIENNTGTLVFWYTFTNPSGDSRVNVHSAPFSVVPPA